MSSHNGPTLHIVCTIPWDPRNYENNNNMKLQN